MLIDATAELEKQHWMFQAERESAAPPTDPAPRPVDLGPPARGARRWVLRALVGRSPPSGVCA
jgi:hypothetical protein